MNFVASIFSRNVRVLVLSSFALVGAVDQATAQDLQLNCSVESRADWIRPTIFIGYRASNNTAVVSDSLILNSYGKPVSAHVQQNNAKRLVLRWSVGDLKDVRGTIVTRMDYEERLNRVKNTITVTARPIRYLNSNFGGKGTCVPAVN